MEHIFEILKNFWILLQQGQLPELGYWNYALLAVLTIIEGPIVSLLGAAAASAGLLRIWAVFASAALGNLTADLLWYTLGYNGKIEFALRIGSWLGLKREHIEKLKIAMQKHGIKILFLAKITAGLMIPSLLVAGLVRLPIKRWLPVIIIGETIWTGSLMMIGYFSTQSIKNVSQDISIITTVASALFFILILLLGRRMLKKTQESED